MRNTALLLIAGLVIAACADDQNPSAPTAQRSSRGALATATADVSRPQAAKPVDQVGFTNIQVAYGPWAPIAAGQDFTTTVSCPAGTIATAGGFELGISAPGPVPSVWRSHANGPLTNPTGWIVSASNKASGAVDGNVQAWVSCAS